MIMCKSTYQVCNHTEVFVSEVGSLWFAFEYFMKKGKRKKKGYQKEKRLSKWKDFNNYWIWIMGIKWFII